VQRRLIKELTITWLSLSGRVFSIRRRLLPVIRDHLVILDSQFPQHSPAAFRNTEINEYFVRLHNVRSYAIYPMLPGKEAWFVHGYGVTEAAFNHNLEGYLEKYPQHAEKVRRLKKHRRYSFDLAYSFFLAETYVLLPFLEANNIPFVFVLYPGGAFGLDNDDSDAMLRRIFSSPVFRSAIVTQPLTQNYLLDNELCSADQITLIYGGFPSYRSDKVAVKQHFPADKPTLDVCFVAAKYSQSGVDKGYDLFIKVAEILATHSEKFRFHVVGNFTKEDIDVTQIDSRITFYGYQSPSFLLDLYSGMDISLSPNRPFQLWAGNFDGFPLNPDASFCGVSMFVSDELEMRGEYVHDRDVAIVSLNAEEIARDIIEYAARPSELYELGRNGMQMTQRLFDIDRQIEARLDVFARFTNLEFRLT
jgi:glycosyltransferase involved in cell wall biosynthesis